MPRGPLRSGEWVRVSDDVVGQRSFQGDVDGKMDVLTERTARRRYPLAASREGRRVSYLRRELRRQIVLWAAGAVVFRLERDASTMLAAFARPGGKEQNGARRVC